MLVCTLLPVFPDCGLVFDGTRSIPRGHGFGLDRESSCSPWNGRQESLDTVFPSGCPQPYLYPGSSGQMPSIFAVGEGVEVSTKSKPAYCLWIHGRSLKISRRDCLLSESRIKKKTR